jgi:predicted TIM-barrel fold metal-dependent hydrolase
MDAKWTLIDTDIHPRPDPARVAHFLAEPWRTRFLSGNRGPGYLGYWNPIGVRRSDAVLPDGSHIADSAQSLASHFLNLYNIEYGLLNVEDLAIGLSPEVNYSAAVVSAINDVIVQEWLPVDPRLRASIIVSPGDPQLAAREIHRLGGHPGVVQVLMPSGARMPYGQRFYHPIYEAAVQCNLPISIHPGSEGTGVSYPPTPAGYPSTYFEFHTGLVTSYIAHLISLVTEGVFVKFPTLKWVLIEGGVSWLPPLLWRFDKNYKALRQTTPWLTRPPSEYVHEHVFLTTQPMEEPDDPNHLRQILGMFDAGRMLMFSSDFPHWDGDTPDFAARGLPADLRPRVMSETARELYGLPRSVANVSKSELESSHA